MKKNSFVFAKIPDAGLANMLLTWAEAAVFAKKNQLPLKVSRWFRFRIGPFIRMEKSKRLYIRNFNDPNILDLLKQKFYPKQAMTNSFDFDTVPKEKTIYCFDKTPEYYDFTCNLRKHRQTVKELLKGLVRSKVWDRVAKYSQPEIGVHIRLGDFKRANISTDIQYFINAIRKIRSMHGHDLKVTIFSDGSEQELKGVIAEGNVTLAKTKKDIDDLLLLSKSKYFVLSQDSSFGYFASFVSNGELICKPSNKNGIVTDDIPELIIAAE